MESILFHVNGFTREEIQSGSLGEESSSTELYQEIEEILNEGNLEFKLVPNKLKVVHYPQVPCKPYEVEVKDEYEAKKIIDILAFQHLFLFEENIIPDYSNIISVVMLVEEAGEWEDYYNDKEMMDWDELEETYFEL